MVNIIQSVLQYPELLEVIQESRLSIQEKSYFDYIRECYANSGKYPSIGLVSNKFPELRFQDSMGNPISVLSEEDSRIYLSNFFKKRENQEKSKLMMTLASEVLEKGITSDIIDRISSESVKESDDHENTIETVDSFRKYYEEKKTKPEGISTDIKAIDDRIGGLAEGCVMTIAGYTSHGKSLLANNMAYSNSITRQYNSCILSMEVPKEQVLANLLVRHAQDPKFANEPKFTARDLEKGRLSPEQEDFIFDRLMPDFYSSDKGKIVIYDESDIKDTRMSTLKNKIIEADDLCRRETGYPLNTVYVDHIQLLKFENGSKKSAMEVINDAVSFFHKLALNFRVVDNKVEMLSVVLLSQINRESYKKAAKSKNRGAYNLTALADANEIERASQVIITIFMDAEEKQAKEAKICLLKNRQGENLNDPESVFCDAGHYVIGDSLSGDFANTIEMDSLEDVFGGAGLDMFGL